MSPVGQWRCRTTRTSARRPPASPSGNSPRPRNAVLWSIVAGVILVATVGAAVHSSWRAILYGVTAAVLVYDTWITPHRLRRRIDELSIDQLRTDQLRADAPPEAPPSLEI